MKNAARINWDSAEDGDKETNTLVPLKALPDELLHQLHQLFR
jgi:hypothetical protein